MTVPPINKSALKRVLKNSGEVRFLMSLKCEEVKYDLMVFIKLTSAVRKLQKKYYSCTDKELRKQILIECKRAELKMDEEGNRLWRVHSLKSFSLR